MSDYSFKRCLTLSVFGLALILGGCSHSVEKASIPTTANPTEEAQKLGSDIDQARNDHVDVLAHKNFRNAEKSLAKARRDLSDGDSQQDILDDVAYGRAYLDAAKHQADERRPNWTDVLKTRQMAIEAGARTSPNETVVLGEIDDDLRDEIESSTPSRSKTVATLQTRYMDLELASLKSKNLGNARAKIYGATNDHRAKRDAPLSLRQAEIDFATAENMIVANRSKPEAYKESVDKANNSATYLMDVITVAHQNPKTLDEKTAMGIVDQNNRLAAAKGELTAAEKEAAAQSKALSERDRELALQNEKLKTAEGTIGMQAAIDKARQEFSEDEADVYQQGNKLLIRLKKMNFSSGRAELPPASIALLGKVKDVAIALKPQEVTVEGHTDSTGSEAVNQKLSADRAEAVATYLEDHGLDKEQVEAQGFGFAKPIATNKTSSGRAQNRRVDVIITPASSANAESSVE